MSVMGGFFDPPHMPLDTPATFIAGGRSAYLEDRHHALIHSFFRDALIHTIPGAGALDVGAVLLGVVMN